MSGVYGNIKLELYIDAGLGESFLAFFYAFGRRILGRGSDDPRSVLDGHQVWWKVFMVFFFFLLSSMYVRKSTAIYTSLFTALKSNIPLIPFRSSRRSCDYYWIAAIFCAASHLHMLIWRPCSQAWQHVSVSNMFTMLVHVYAGNSLIQALTFDTWFGASFRSCSPRYRV